MPKHRLFFTDEDILKFPEPLPGWVWCICEQEPCLRPPNMMPEEASDSDFDIWDCAWISHGNPADKRRDEGWWVYVPDEHRRSPQFGPFDTWQDALQVMLTNMFLGNYQ